MKTQIIDQMALQNAALVILAGISILNAILMYQLQTTIVKFWDKVADIWGKKSD